MVAETLLQSLARAIVTNLCNNGSNYKMMQNNDVTTEWKKMGKRERGRDCVVRERVCLWVNAIRMLFVLQMESMIISRHISSAASKQMDDNNSRKKETKRKLQHNEEAICS